MQAFGTVGALEAAYFRETGKQLLLSEQGLMDCGWYLNNKACFGGYQVSHPVVSTLDIVMHIRYMFCPWNSKGGFQTDSD